MLDGRHTGTGGGNHIVLGGATPQRFAVPAPPRSAAQPDLPTGTTIPRCRICSRGCSSAPPRRRRASDEARNDSLYELEIAFQQFPQPGAEVPAVARRPRCSAIC